MAVTINGGTGVTIGSGAAYTFGDNSTQTSAADPADFGFKNRIINGAMVVDQRNAGASVTPAASAYTVDRWRLTMTQASKFSVQQNQGSVTPPAGYTNYIGVTSLSAYSVVSSDYFNLLQRVEGYNAADLGWGAAGAATVTLSFWVRSSLTGTFGAALSNVNANRTYPFTYTIPGGSSNTWVQISVTIPGDTSGTWNKTNDVGIALQFSLGAGSTYTSTAGTWQAGNYWGGVTGQVSVVGTNGATWQITGVQLEKNTGATGFDVRPYGTELALCQRYYEFGGQYQTSWTASSALGAATVVYAVQKRANPTLVVSYVSGSGSQPVASATGFTQYSPGAVVGDNARFNFTASAEL
jgi:hypothetical protein